MVEPLPAAAGFPQAIRGRALVCFAVKEEARFFSAPETEILISGMGCSNAERAVNKALRERSYDLVLSCGFAGGLNPALRVGTVLFEADEGAGLTPHLLAAGAMAANFHFADRVAITAAEKTLLRGKTGADAIEMESRVIRSMCKASGIPSATVRVISDSATENLPLDFNALMSPDKRLDYGKLLWSLLKSPGALPGLLRLQRQTKRAARILAEVLGKLIRAQP